MPNCLACQIRKICAINIPVCGALATNLLYQGPLSNPQTPTALLEQQMVLYLLIFYPQELLWIQCDHEF